MKLLKSEIDYTLLTICKGHFHEWCIEIITHHRIYQKVEGLFFGAFEYLFTSVSIIFNNFFSIISNSKMTSEILLITLPVNTGMHSGAYILTGI
jgi:hypothetical protein